MSDEQMQFELAIAMTVTSAMQIGITSWNDKTVQAMTPSGKAEFMANLSRSFASQIVRIVEQKFGEKSSS